MLHGVRSKKSHKGRLKHNILGRFKIQSQQVKTIEKGSFLTVDSKAKHKNQLNKATKWQANRQIPMSTLHEQ